MSRLPDDHGPRKYRVHAPPPLPEVNETPPPLPGLESNETPPPKTATPRAREVGFLGCIGALFLIVYLIVNMVNRFEWTDWLTRNLPQPVAAVEQAEPGAKRVESQRADKRAARKRSEYTRDEFKNLVMNRTKQEVLDLIGKPIQTMEFLDDMEHWSYTGITFDPVTGFRDLGTELDIKGGIVISVSFFSGL